ncbi:hypothetical protein NM688_g7433 [Phlebia brevispora]|uniref:Uncharacterized protein n=1 Tax=Phlebia brevispora TaxID=194682 RepID=A0ACC1S5D2_9APHY|nr:hypothetical protein NM688_g7433 [Phlebia brevispora]
MDPLARLRSFPKAPSPNDDPASIRGNLNLELKQLNANILAYHVGAGGRAFAGDVINGLKIVEINVRKKRYAPQEDSQGPDDMEAEIIYMLNVHGGMSGGCFVAILDIVTFSALFALGSVVNVDPSGVSTNMDIRWHRPATPGMTLTLVGSSVLMSQKGRNFTSRAEMYDKKSGKLLASVTHSVAPLQNLPSPLDQKDKPKL